MDFIKYTFNEEEWCVYLTEDDDDDLTDGQAQVFFDKKEIYVKRGSLTLRVIKHELFHVYFAYCYTDSANLDAVQVEEICASLFEDKGEIMDARAKDIYKKLKVLRDTKKVEEA